MGGFGGDGCGGCGLAADDVPTLRACGTTDGAPSHCEPTHCEDRLGNWGCWTARDRSVACVAAPAVAVVVVVVVGSWSRGGGGKEAGEVSLSSTEMH